MHIVHIVQSCIAHCTFGQLYIVQCTMYSVQCNNVRTIKKCALPPSGKDWEEERHELNPRLTVPGLLTATSVIIRLL